jgi:class 3 adenylate cyclase
MSDSPELQFAHVLMLDIVGYSTRSHAEQRRLIQELQELVRALPEYRSAAAPGDLLCIPTGDGMALVFFRDPVTPLQAAVRLARSLPDKAGMQLRMGIHSGPVYRVEDINANANVSGGGINTAQRIMDVGDPGHVLVSAAVAELVRQVGAWPLIDLGDCEVKHGQRLHLFNVCGADFGNPTPPSRLKRPAAAPPRRGAREPAPRPGTRFRKVALLYKPALHPDTHVLRLLEEQLHESGYEVFVDNQQKIDAAWARAIEEPIRQADAVIAVISPRSLQSEMLEFELETAHDQQIRTGKPAILPVIIGDAEPLEGPAGAIVRPLPRFAWSGPEADQKLVAELLAAIAEPLPPRAHEVKLEPVGGAVPADSPFYIRRRSDDEFLQALEAGESILLVKGARQTGKTSMLAQGTRRARELGRQHAITDFQKFNAAQMASDDRFYRLLAATLSRQLGVQYDFDAEWDEIFGANLNMESFMRSLLLERDTHLVWFMDEVDKLFTAPFASDFFGLVRSWHNARSTEPDGPWRRLTVIIAYATEAHLFIQDLNQSPFNVGRRLDLEDFSLQQTVDLNARYGGPLRSCQECEALHKLLGGQPFLTRRALDALATGKCDLTGLLEEAARDTGPFADHLQRILVSVSRLAKVTEYVKGILGGTATPNQDAYYRLLTAGIIRQDRAGHVVFRCELYRRYLQRHLE